MKKILLLTVLISIAAACHHGMGGVAGSGNSQKQKRDVGSFTSLSTEGAFEIDIVCQKPLSLEIEGDDNILPLVSTEVSNNVLHIRNTRSYSTSEPIRVRISVPDLEGISTNGGGRIDITGLKSDKFEIDVNGAPTLRVAGEANSVDIDTNGAGKIDTNKLRAANVVVDSKGVSKVDVYASEKLDVTVSGPSNVTYDGDPKVNQSVNGPGSVRKKASEGS